MNMSVQLIKKATSSGIKKHLGINVLDAARKRISKVFDDFPRIYLSFSGGKDSTVMLHLVMDEAIRRNKKIGLLFYDWECQFKMTIDHVRDMFNLYQDHIEPFWISVPLKTLNGCSMFEPEWIAWDKSKKELWIRQPEPISISQESYFPFYNKNMLFEEFMPAFAQWYSQGKLTANFIGIRCGESLNRWRTICAGKKQGFENKQWFTWSGEACYNAYPIYDWQAKDDWIYNARYNKPYNKIYDRMHQSGMTINQMRIDEPFGDTQRISLSLYHIIEPETWSKMVARVSGANTGALYAKDKGSVLGNGKIDLPKGHTWESFAKSILSVMPEKTAEHYKNKISVYLKWYRDRGYPNGIPDCLDGDLGAKDMPSWRRICKVILRNDYWCKGLCFSPTKTAAYEKYLKLMKKRRSEWKII